MNTYDRTARNRTGLKHSDVCLSCRSLRPGRSEQALAEFKPTRVEWSYITDRAFIERVKSRGAKFAGAVNTIGGHRFGRDAVDLDGNRLVAPWMTGFDNSGGPGWACVNSPDAVAYREQWLRTFLDLGADAIQHDDWAFNLAAFDWGGCFCSHCMKAFDAYLQEHLPEERCEEVGIVHTRQFDYREYLRTQYGIENARGYQRRRREVQLQDEMAQFERVSTRRYFKRLLSSARAFRGQDVPLSINANLLPHQFAENFILDLIDYLVGETHATYDSYPELVWMLKLADALNLPQVVSPFPAGQIRVNEVRGVLGAVYALGHWPLVPWDVWRGPHTRERWFGTREEYGDIFDFVRSNRRLFDDFAPWAEVALFVPATSDKDRAAAFAERGKGLAAALLAAGAPFRIITAGAVGGGLVEIPPDPADFTGLEAIFLCGPLDELDNARREEVLRLADGIRCVDTSDAPADAVKKAKLTPACRACAPEVHAFPRVGPGASGTMIAVHLVNRDYDKATDTYREARDVTVEIHEKTLGALTGLKAAAYYQPGRDRAEPAIEKKAGKACIVVPELKQWGIIEIA